MAWSDAARAAAAEARRMHGSAKRDTYLRSDARNIAAGAKVAPDKNVFGQKKFVAMQRRQVKNMLAERKGIAQRIKAIRSGQHFPAAHERTGLQRQAVLNTMVRNLMKRKD